MADLHDADDKKLGDLLQREEEDLAQILSQKYGIQYDDLTRLSINTDALRLIPENIARTAEMAAFQKVGKKLSVAVRAPHGEKVAPVLEDLKTRGYDVTQFIVSQQSLARAWEHYKDLSFAVETKEGVFDISGEELRKLIGELTTLEKVQGAINEVSQMKKAYRISRILEVVLAGAFAIEASDVHIEPEQTNVRLRYRLDGVLTDVTYFDVETYQLLLSRVKLLSGLKINIKNEAQDGRFSVVLDNVETEIRSSVIPGAYGESIVLRILNPNTISVPFEQLGIEPKLLKVLEREITKPNGMLLNTGPTGSGKTTTLYAFLRKIHTPDIKIITLEDPIEYHLPGIVQTQVEKEKYTFESGLRSILRQDPDVIMVGEIRDEEVAKTAVDAALTGHFVFSTLHTNNAAGAFPRLADFDVDMKVVGSAVSVVMAQRLVRILCKECKKQIPLEGKDKERVEKVLKGIVDRSNVPADTSKIYAPVGCPACNGLGFKGRIGIFEALIVDDEVDKIIRAAPGEREIQAVMAKRDILSMTQDGVLKALAGVTALSELDRVVDLDENVGG